MKLTSIRDNNGKKVGNDYLNFIGTRLVYLLGEAGFITEYTVVNSSCIKLGLHMRSFKVDVNKLGYNASLNPHMNYKKGYKRTCTPTWDQRVKYNNIINKFLDENNVVTNITSQDYTIRKGSTSFTEYDWMDQKPNWVYENERKGFNVVTLDEVA